MFQVPSSKFQVPSSKFQVLSLLISSIILLLFFTSCEKNYDLSDKGDVPTAHASERSFSEIIPPVIQDSMAVFSDSLHFFSFYESLDDLYDEDIEAFYSYVDSNLAFQSVGHLLHTDTLLQSLEDKYDPIVNNEVMRYVVNPNYEFQIGNDLITYISYEQILVSDVSDISTRQEIRSIEKDGSFIPIEMIPDSAFWGRSDEISSFFRTWCGCTVYIREVDCETVSIWGRCSNLLGGRGRGTVHYQDFAQGWGPTTWPTQGPLPSFNEESVRGNYSFSINISEPRDVYARAIPKCVLGNTVYADKEVDVNNTCDYKTRSSEWMWIQYTNFDIALSMKLRHYRDFFTDRVSIEVVAYKKYGPKDWRQENINYLYSRLEVDYRNRPSNHSSSCQVWDSKWAQHSCSNCKKSSRRIKTPRRSGAFCAGDIIGKTGGLAGSDILWEVSETLEGFDCCD